VNQDRPAGMPVARLSSVRLLFDRGTTLLRDLDPGLDPSAIPGVLWDPRAAGKGYSASFTTTTNRGQDRVRSPFIVAIA